MPSKSPVTRIRSSSRRPIGRRSWKARVRRSPSGGTTFSCSWSSPKCATTNAMPSSKVKIRNVSLFGFSSNFWSIRSRSPRNTHADSRNCVGIEWHNRMFTSATIFPIGMLEQQWVHSWKGIRWLDREIPADAKMQARRARSLSVTFDGNAKCDPVMDGGYTYTLFRQPSFHTVRLALRNSERELGVGSSTEADAAAAVRRILARANYSQISLARRVSTRDNTKRLDNCL